MQGIKHTNFTKSSSIQKDTTNKPTEKTSSGVTSLKKKAVQCVIEMWVDPLWRARCSGRPTRRVWIDVGSGM